MEVIHFALGLRFDPVFGTEKEDGASLALSRVLSVLDGKLLSGMKLYAGNAPIDQNDDEEITTVVFMGCGMKKTRKLYYAIKNAPLIMAALTERRGIIQTNAVSKLEGLDYYGDFDDSGALFGGDRAFERIEMDEFTAKQTQYKPNILLAPDKFKGTLTQAEAIKLLRSAAKKAMPFCKTFSVPVADGGDGTARILSNALGGYRRTCEVTAPYGNTVTAEYYIVNGETALIEMATASGLALAGDMRYPLDATSRGTGELIVAALNAGAKKIMLCVGGSATNDGGIGAASALGVRFLNKNGDELAAIPENMEQIDKLDMSNIEPAIKECEIVVLCDVNNPMTGINGATYVYGAQKGADRTMQDELEKEMLKLERVYNAYAEREICSLPGMGAAGGITAMLSALFGAKLESGASAVLDLVKFDEKLKKADLVVTGEGMLDETSADSGKIVGEIIKRAEKMNVQSVIIAGRLGNGAENVKHISSSVRVYSTIEGEPSEQQISLEPEKRLYECAYKAFCEFYKRLNAGVDSAGFIC